MKITNRKNLPQIIVDAVSNDQYNPGERTDYSVTTLLSPAYQKTLQKKHSDEIFEDVADRLWAMYGSAVHYIIELGAKDGDIIERRFYGEFTGWMPSESDFTSVITAPYGLKTISAQIDHYRDGVITDWKLTSAYKVKKALQEPDEDWTAQLNVQKVLMEMAGHEVKELRIGAMVRDWTKAKYMSEEGYPDQIEYIEIPIWDEAVTRSWIHSRITAHEVPQPCSQRERWQDNPTYAITKKGGSRPAKVEKSRPAAIEYIDHKGWSLDNYEIIERTGPNRRCEFYCNVNEFCDFYRETYLDASELPFK